MSLKLALVLLQLVCLVLSTLSLIEIFLVVTENFYRRLLERNERYNEERERERKVAERFAITSKRMKETCAICMKKHRRKNAIKLICGHEFGNHCFATWSHSCMMSRLAISCPMCRRENV